jgi:hypothetical protein
MSAEDPAIVIRRLMEEHAQHVAKFGHVPAPVTIHHQGKAVVAVGRRLLIDERWNSFHDFLFTYIGTIFEQSWFAEELKKLFEAQHPIMQWYQMLADFGAARGVERGKLTKIEKPAAHVIALLTFAYDLYILENNGLLHPRLVDRLKRIDQFQGARYEAYVTAAFVKAEFAVVLEDEADTSTSHCEFTATHRASGKAYSVEAKSRVRSGFLGQAGARKPLEQIEADMSGLLVNALRKAAAHDRIVFIDINIPPSEAPTPEAGWFQKLGSQFARLAKNQQGAPLLPAFVFFTNAPYHFIEGDSPLRGASILFTGFNIPEFEGESADQEVIRTKYSQVLELYDSLLRHNGVPHELGRPGGPSEDDEQTIRGEP